MEQEEFDKKASDKIQRLIERFGVMFRHEMGGMPLMMHVNVFGHLITYLTTQIFSCVDASSGTDEEKKDFKDNFYTRLQKSVENLDYSIKEVEKAMENKH